MAKANTKIEILRDTVCGGERVKTGDVTHATDAEARLLVSLGKAAVVDGEGQPVKAESPAGPLSTETPDAPVAKNK